MHDGMQFDPIQGQGHKPLKVGNPFIFKGYLLRHSTMIPGNLFILGQKVKGQGRASHKKMPAWVFALSELLVEFFYASSIR